jgi:hypothetical protein
MSLYPAILPFSLPPSLPSFFSPLSVHRSFPSSISPTLPSFPIPPLQVVHLEYKRQHAVRVAVTPGVTYRVVAAAWGPGVQVQRRGSWREG